MNSIQLTELYTAQAQLDAHIQEQHKVTYTSTRDKRILALLVEVGEMINETKVFKFWSKKPANDKAIILDEYADGLHFFLSLGLEVGSKKMTYDLQPSSVDITALTISVFAGVSQLKSQFTVAVFEQAFQDYLILMILLGFTVNEVLEGYFKKLGVNYTRQQNNY
jgi:dimeric dUTPase (all-alpha-NTP-PPase superfamily)